jgi:uncharacterized membrane protein YraQ (UPF0718 family)
LRKAIAFAFGETVEHTLPWLILGVVVAALLEPFVQPRSLAAIPASFQVPAGALLGLVGYVCPSGITPVVAVLIHKGLAPGAALAFLITSAAANVRVVKPLAATIGRGHAARYLMTVLGSSITAGGFGQLALGRELDIPLHAAAAASPSWAGVFCAAALGLASATVLLRRGPRYLLGRLVPSHDPR